MLSNLHIEIMVEAPLLFCSFFFRRVFHLLRVATCVCKIGWVCQVLPSHFRWRIARSGGRRYFPRNFFVIARKIRETRNTDCYSSVARARALRALHSGAQCQIEILTGSPSWADRESGKRWRITRHGFLFNMTRDCDGHTESSGTQNFIKLSFFSFLVEIILKTM